MEDEDSNNGGEGVIGKRESRGVALHYGDAGTFVFVLLGEAGDKGGIKLKASDAAGAAKQFLGGGARASADFEHMIAKRIAGDDPREQFAFGEETPNRGATKPVFKAIHERNQSGEVTLI